MCVMVWRRRKSSDGRRWAQMGTDGRTAGARLLASRGGGVLVSAASAVRVGLALPNGAQQKKGEGTAMAERGWGKRHAGLVG